MCAAYDVPTRGRFFVLCPQQVLALKVEHKLGCLRISSAEVIWHKREMERHENEEHCIIQNFILQTLCNNYIYDIRYRRLRLAEYVARLDSEAT